MNRKHLLTLFILLTGFSASFASAKDDSKAIKQVEAQVEQLRSAMISADVQKLKAVTSSELNYGHSGGHVEGQAEFIEKLTSGNSDFVTIELKDQTIQIAKDVAIVRHTLIATTNDRGKPGEVNIGVLLIWQKQKGEWKLLARQAFKTH